jgi:hypothetical protein
MSLRRGPVATLSGRDIERRPSLPRRPGGYSE